MSGSKTRAIKRKDADYRAVKTHAMKLEKAKRQLAAQERRERKMADELLRQTRIQERWKILLEMLLIQPLEPCGRNISTREQLYQLYNLSSQ